VHSNEPGISDWIPWSLPLTIVLTALVTVITHVFFAFRIHRLSRGNWFVVGPILVLAFARLGFATTTCTKMLIFRSIDKFVANAAWVFTMGLVTSSILDVVVTASLVWYLDHARTGFAGMDQIVNTLCRYTIENGLLTSVGIVISLGCWLGMRSNLIFMAIHFVLAKLYANSLLATLNNRVRIRERVGNSVAEGGQLVFNLSRGPTLKRSTDQLGAIQVNKEIYTRRDEEADVGLASIASRTVTGKDSMDTGSSSKKKALEEDLAAA